MIGSILLRRLVSGVITLWAISLVIFAVLHILPGDPRAIALGQEYTPQQYAAVTREMRLDHSLVNQYWYWLKGLVTGNWGTSLMSPNHVSNILGSDLKYTAILTLFAMVIIIPLATVIGVYSAVRSGRLADAIVSFATLSLAAVPAFAIGVVVIYLLATNVLKIVPAASIFDPEMSPFAQTDLMILPVLTTVLGLIPYPIRMVRAAMIEALESDAVMLARLKGLPERTVIFRHALRSCMGPVVQAFGLTLVFLSGGTVIVENVFSYPGVGHELVQGVGQRDFPVIQTLVVILAVFTVLINLLTDVAVMAVTPRLRTRL
jgi:peptide/nickel transport system permease protein